MQCNLIFRFRIFANHEERTHTNSTSYPTGEKRHNVKANRLIRFEQFRAETVEGQKLLFLRQSIGIIQEMQSVHNPIKNMPHSQRFICLPTSSSIVKQNTTATMKEEKKNNKHTHTPAKIFGQ